MIRSKTILAGAVALFFTVEILLGIRFQTGSSYGAQLRFLTVLLACLCCVLFAERSWTYATTQLALLMTVCADLFLVLPSSPNQLPGMLFFSVAQLSYGARLYLDESRSAYRIVQLISRGAVSAVALLATVIVLGKSCDAVALVSVFYYANLVLNLIFACTQMADQYVLAVGFILFIFCDTVVGLAFMDPYLPMPEGSFIDRLIHPGFDLAWAFYLPSQMLLAVSLLPKCLKRIAVGSPA